MTIAAAWRSRAAALSGATPPTLLRARLIDDAEEVLVCTYTSDLRFFETTCLPEARAVRARVTVVHDDAATLSSPGEVRHAGTSYVSVPVRCRRGGEFHPKLLVVASTNRALVAIGSGNATTAGWHHNAELWTTIAAEPDEWPDSFHAVADWLTGLSDAVLVDRFGEQRLADVAKLLKRHPAVTAGPTIAHNLHTPLLDQLPNAADAATATLEIASPFLDPRLAALDAVTARLAPQVTTLALTRNAVGPGDLVAQWAGEPGRTVVEIVDSRYHHGKVIQWTTADTRAALTGSANVTSAALLRTTAEPHGNCELGLLIDLDVSLLPPTTQQPVEPDDVAGLLRALTTHPASSGPRLLRVMTDGGGLELSVMGPLHEVIDATLRTPTSTAVLENHAENAGIVTAHVAGQIAPGVLCELVLRDGTISSAVRVTDSVGVCLRPGSGSPLEDTALANVLGRRELSNRLLDALAELAGVRASDAAGNAPGARGSAWRRVAERSVGPALVHFALGGAIGSASSSAVLSDPPAPSISIEDAWDESADDDVGDWDAEDAESDVYDPWANASDPVSVLAADATTARRLADLIDRRSENLDTWELPAVLALLRVALLVAAGGGWDDDEWARSVQLLLSRLAATDDDAKATFNTQRQAASVVSLAALATTVHDWTGRSEVSAGYAQLVDALDIDPDRVERALVEHYAADLHLGFGPQLSVDAIRDAIQFLVTSDLLERMVDDLEGEYPGIFRAASRLLKVVAPNARGSAMRLLSRCSEAAPLAVFVDTGSETCLAAWIPKRLVLHQSRAGREWGAEYVLAIGPGAHVGGSLPRAHQQWVGPMPAHSLAELVGLGLLPP